MKINYLYLIAEPDLYTASYNNSLSQKPSTYCLMSNAGIVRIF
jgi:hypothetical protein